MKTTRRYAAAAALFAVLGLGGCALSPMIGPNGMGGLSISSFGSPFQLAPGCTVARTGFGAGGLSAAAAAGARLQQVNRIQAKYNLASSDVRAERATWKWVAEGGC